MIPDAKSKVTGVFHVINMDCSMCTKVITRRLQKLEGVTRVGVNYITEKAYVDYDPAKVTPETIRKTIEKAGYKAFETKSRMAV